MFMFDIMPVFFFVFFIMFFGVIIYNIYNEISTRKKPVIPVEAIVKGKRSRTNQHNHSNGEFGSHVTTSTSYYATFEFTNGERVELTIKGNDYGMLSEGDRGILEFQGNRFVSFKRN